VCGGSQGARTKAHRVASRPQLQSRRRQGTRGEKALLILCLAVLFAEVDLAVVVFSAP
jgi:cell division protein FtsL